MATVTGLTSAKMLELADENVVDGLIVDDRLILTKRDGSIVDAGIVKGEQGVAGATGVGPTGSITMFAGASAPSGHLLCDGSAVSRTTYSALYDVIGTTYGVGDSSTTFNLPNLQGRVPVGLNSADTQFDALGETGGAKTHTLTSAEMPVHTHVQNSHNHTQNSHTHTQDAHNHSQTGHDHTVASHNHGPGNLTGFMTYATGVSRTRSTASTSTTNPIMITSTDVSDLGVSATTTANTSTNPVTTTAVNNAATAVNDATTPTNIAATATNQNAGSGGAHNNLQPYLVLNYIIKT